jgi:hypothetical protein
VLLAAANGGSK